jgi:hypothetical protein
MLNFVNLRTTAVQANSSRGVTQVFNIGRMDQNTFKQTKRRFGRVARGAIG